MAVAVLIRGGGDLASGVALRLYRSGFRVIISELAQPLAVRRSVSFAEAVYTGSFCVEDCVACRVPDLDDSPLVEQILAEGRIPILIDPDGKSAAIFHPDVVVDARMLKRNMPRGPYPAKLLIGLGPGFAAGRNCDAVIETNRGISMGRVIWHGPAEADTRMPEAISGRGAERVLRASADGIVAGHANIGDLVAAGQIVAETGGKPVTAAFKGVLRGLIHPGLYVQKGFKIGDIDPRSDPRVCAQVSDKALAVAGGVLEAILSKLQILES